MKNEKVEKILEKAKEEGEIFLGTFRTEELRSMCFEPIWGEEEEFFKSFEYVEVYLIYDGKEYKFKYIFDGDPRYFEYDRESELGKYFVETLEEYIKG